MPDDQAVSTIDPVTMQLSLNGHSATGSRFVGYLWRERILESLLRPFIATCAQVS